MQLLDMSSHLPSLKRLQGMKKWYGRDKLRYYASWAEAVQVSLQVGASSCSGAAGLVLAQVAQALLCSPSQSRETSSLS